ncbi:MAG: DEAD/DEAH box helicase [Planctomycetota bacterium]|nr:DEAD/DEAH box helicase [Planctomycetota bacterium]
MTFDTLRLIQPLLRAVGSEGYTTPTPIQVQAIPPVLEGKDVLGCAQTGTGKTAAFALPILQRLMQTHAPVGHGGHGKNRRPIRALILAPTRELAAQIGESFAAYGKHTPLKFAVIYGGVKQGNQVRALQAGVDILVATPGRLLDLLNQRLLRLDGIEIFVLDEADRMLDMGFIHDIRRVIAVLPTDRQTLLFSATIPTEIRKLSAGLLRQPVMVKAPSESPAADTVGQVLYYVEPTAKAALLEELLRGPDMTRTLVFTRTKRGADRVAKHLAHCGIGAEAIHANKSQNQRLRALGNFKEGRTRVLVASDIASRGLDVVEISHVVNFDLPDVPETYVHRIGRTGRAGAAGQAVSFCSDDQRDELRQIERLLGRAIPVLSHAVKATAESALAASKPARGRGQQQQHGHRARVSTGSHGSYASHASRKTPAPAAHAAGTPEQQQAGFWRSRRKYKRPLTGGPSTGRRGR